MTPCSTASDLGLHWLLWLDCPNTLSKYVISTKMILFSYLSVKEDLKISNDHIKICESVRAAEKHDSNRSLTVICGALWLLVVRLFCVCMCLFCPLLWSYCCIWYEWLCDHLTGEKGTGCFAFLCFVKCCVMTKVCFLFLLGSLVGYVL